MSVELPSSEMRVKMEAPRNLNVGLRLIFASQSDCHSALPDCFAQVLRSDNNIPECLMVMLSLSSISPYALIEGRGKRAY